MKGGPFERFFYNWFGVGSLRFGLGVSAIEVRRRSSRLLSKGIARKGRGPRDSNIP